MKNEGWIDSQKHDINVRILSMNPRGFGPHQEEKVVMMIDYAKRHQIDRILLSSPDQKWTSTKVDKLKRRFRAVNKEVDIIVLDSR